ncbi:multiheme c-type cytochrome [candidate division KSB1 bacterium]
MKSAALCLYAGLLATLPAAVSGQEVRAGEELYGAYNYQQFEKPETCGSCHVDIYQQWRQSMMSQAYTHHWDEIEYFKLAVPHADRKPMVAGVKAGCNGCHTPIAFLAGDTPPPPPSANSRANEGVSCDVCHTISGFKGDTPYNFNYIIEPGRLKYGNRIGVESPAHRTAYSDFIRTPDFCGICHNEMSPYGIWVKSTHLEWKEGPYAEQGVRCQDCHEFGGHGRNALMAKEEYDDVAQHVFHGAHSPSKLRGAVEIRIHPDSREYEPGEPVVLKVQLHNAKVGHKIPSGSAEERQLWLTVEARDAAGNRYHIPVDEKGFDGEEYTISSNDPAYQDIGEAIGDPSFAGLPRDALPYEGDRVFRLPYFDENGVMTIQQWNTASLGVDYRIGPRETKVEKFTWYLPDDIPEGMVTVTATLNYRRLVKSVADYLNVPEDETEIVMINQTQTTFEIFW